MEGNKNLTLALVWQMMKAYTLSLLAQVSYSRIYSVQPLKKHANHQYQNY